MIVELKKKYNWVHSPFLSLKSFGLTSINKRLKLKKLND